MTRGSVEQAIGFYSTKNTGSRTNQNNTNHNYYLTIQTVNSVIRQILGKYCNIEK